MLGVELDVLRCWGLLLRLLPWTDIEGKNLRLDGAGTGLLVVIVVVRLVNDIEFLGVAKGATSSCGGRMCGIAVAGPRATQPSASAHSWQ